MNGHRRPSPPIAAQIAILLGVTLLVAQVLALLVVLFSPPPRPSVYRLADVASALQGGSLESRLGRPLIRSVADAPPDRRPDRQARGPLGERRLEASLASVLQVPADRVQFQREGRPWFAELIDGRRPARAAIANVEFRQQLGAPPPGEPPSRQGAGPGPGPDSPALVVGGGLRFRSMLFGPGGELFGDFSAALKRPDGRWTVVRPSPEPFPNDWQRRIMLWLAGCLLLVAPAAWWFANRITAPIHRFAAAAEQLGRDPRSSPPMTLSGPAEIGKAAKAFNDMQVRIKRYVDHRTAMVGAISHDLRTPLARIRFKLEAAQPDKQAILSDVAQMEQMIASVLAFIRDASEPRRRERLELVSLLECVVDDAALVGGEARIAEGEPLVVDGDPLALQRLFANLVDNAVKYGFEADVTTRRDGEQALIEIADRGPGLPEAELEAVFQPFYRAGGARNMDKDKTTGGVGLGLAVARSIARAHGGDVELRTAGAGLVARVALPLAAAT